MDTRPFERDGAHLFVSPHLDDVAISCGGRIRTFVDHRMPVMVLTVFAGDPPSSRLSPLAEWFHALCELGDDPVGTRRNEDVTAMSVLGAQVRHLRLPDSMYREDAAETTSLQHTGLTVAGGQKIDTQLIATIVAEMHVVAGHATIASIHVPLGIGRHVDHLTVRIAAETFVEESGTARRPTLVYYEELPFANRDVDPTWEFELVSGLQPRVHELCPEIWQRKIRAVNAYRSQIAVLRGPDEDLDDELQHYARRIGKGSLVERSWHPASFAW